MAPDFFVVLIHPTALLHKKYTLVRLTTDPLQTVINLNRGCGGPTYYVLRAGCAFRSLGDACRASDFLAKKKRSFSSKKKYLKKLAARHRLPYYSDTRKPPGGTRAFLEGHAPGNYVQTFDRLISKRRK